MEPGKEGAKWLGDQDKAFEQSTGGACESAVKLT
jgi:hypothetical protein